MYRVTITNLQTHGESRFTFKKRQEYIKFIETYWNEVFKTNKHARLDGDSWIVYTAKKDLERVITEYKNI